MLTNFSPLHYVNCESKIRNNAQNIYHMELYLQLRDIEFKQTFRLQILHTVNLKLRAIVKNISTIVEK